MYTWREDWIDKYESSWNINEKFKYLNQIPGKNKVSDQNLDIDDYIEKKIGGLLKNRANLSLKDLSYLGINNLNSFILPKFRFCPLCIREGYHSYFHQFSIINICPFHHADLLNRCPQCNLQLNYTPIVNNRYSYTCECGFELINRFEFLERMFTLRTQNTLPQLLKGWIDSPLRKKGGLEIIPIYGEIPVSIFQLIEKDQFQSRDIIVSSYPLKITSRDEQKIDLINLFNDSKKVYASIGKYLRKGLNSKEVSGINKLARNFSHNPRISKKMTSYILWKMYTNMDNDIRSIDNGKIKYPTIWDEPKFIAKRYNEILIMLYSKLVSYRIFSNDIYNYLLLIFGQLLLFDYYRIENFQMKNNTQEYLKFTFSDWSLVANNLFFGIIIDLNANNLFLIMKR